MTLESIDSLLFTLIVILPGFVLIKASDHLLGKSPFRDNFDFTIWSGFLSLTLYFISNGICKILLQVPQLNHKDYAEPTSAMFFITIFIVSILFLAVHVCLIRKELNKKIRPLIMGDYALKYSPNNSVWDAVLPEYSDYAVVYTSDGMKYGGTILLYTKGIGKDGKANKELFLNEPTLLNTDRNLEDYENDLKGLLLLEQDIKRIEFLGEIKEQENIEKVNGS
ncbi:MAG: hypothetical protein GQ533_05650 [Methanosarcinaceae archaeon]|nr:hypothetical protein [Methanosarcinaceae archaeon]